MSGLNPFRHRKPEVLPVTTKSIDSPAPPPAVASIPDDKPSAFSDVPHQSQNQNQNPTRDVEDSLSSDDDDTSDPFRQDSYLSENDGEEGKDRSEKGHDGIWRWSSFPQPGPDDHASSNSISSSMNTSAGTENKEDLDNLASSTAAPKSSLLAPPTGARTASSSSTDISQQSARPGSLHDSAIGRHTSNAADMNSRALASRSANREKKPPPPPKNRHGKLINPPSQTPPSVSSNRFSYHGAPSEISISHTPSTPSYSNRPSPQAGTDYFSPKSSENERPDTLRRSQSQYKRPPTPPLSRRHSQMTRSKSTLSKANPNRLSMPVGKEGVNSSSPPSPGTNSLTPSLRKPSRTSLFPTDENTLKHTPSAEDHLQAETSTMSNPKRASSVRRTGQGTSSSAVPPPPPPRRARFSNDSTRPTSVLLEKTREEDAFPHPSNANHILDDLSRLQKEVDDLRGRYESRKGSH